MKHPNFYLFLIFILLAACTKKKSLEDDFSISDDSLSIYLELANKYNLSLSEKEIYNQKALEVILDQPNDSLHRVNLFKVANRYYNMGSWNKYKKTVHLVLDEAIVKKDSAAISKAYDYLGDYYRKQSIADSAFIYYFKSEKIYSLRNDIKRLSQVKLNKASLQFSEGDYYGAEKNVFSALRTNKNKDSGILYEAYNLLGVLYNEMGEYDKSLEFHQKAIKAIDPKVIPIEFQSKATSLNNIGAVYLNKKDYENAEAAFNNGLSQINLKSQKPSLYAMLLDNYAFAQFKLQKNQNLPELYYDALKIRDSLNLTAGIIVSKLHLSEYYVAQNENTKGIVLLKEALKTARSSKNERNVLVALKQLSVLEPKKAVSYSKEYIRINDSLQKAERVIGDKFTRIEYETDQVINENEALNLQNRTLFYIFTVLCLIGLFFYVYKTQQIRNRELVFKQQQQLANESIYNLMIQQQNQIEAIRIKEKKRVAQELHDGVLSRMFGLRMSLDSLNSMNDEQAAKQRDIYLQELKVIEQDIREISHDLNKEKSELINNFVAILDKLFEDQKRNFQSHLVVKIDRKIKWELVDNAKKINVYRIIQEALQNCNKYAKATEIKVVIKAFEDHLYVIISDNGVGFKVNQAKKGIGLQNIAYRTKECLGTLSIDSDVNGTVLEIVFPLYTQNE
ncbi:tetratricopeptide repeat-containing sensor histidine kinase [Flavobacterium agrisoli]|uniref:histidine kinase n=1 Tax=Flavobacterium agrisoli TaxID=2793066 RepID=A0A934PMX5_9FLAO|nr:ATP-binding protein [Flavobacterium agrisoli]MBK0369426.1 tetratricopeptide repeat protein [Flavobacterium agrisoli]